MRRRRLLLVIEETLGETVYKTRPFALGFGGIAPLGKRSSGFERRRGTRGGRQRANEDGKNEIKRLHDRLESVLFQIAVVGNATIGKKCRCSSLWSKRESDCERLFGLDVFAWKQVLSFAVASFFSLCVINTFSFVCLDVHPNRQSVFRFAN